MDDDTRYLDAMTRAIALATSAGASGERSIGAVVLAADGAVLAEREDEVARTGDPLAHAAVLAIRDAAGATGSWRLDGAVLVTTLEPCLLCAGAAVAARVARVVLGAPDPLRGALGSLYNVGADPRLNHEIAIVRDVLLEACRALRVA